LFIFQISSQVTPKAYLLNHHFEDVVGALQTSLETSDDVAVPAASTDLTNWTVAGTGIRVIDNSTYQRVYTNSTGGNIVVVSGTGSIEQKILAANLVANKIYGVTFFMSCVPGTPLTTSVTLNLTGGISQVFSHDCANVTEADLLWSYNVLPFKYVSGDVDVLLHSGSEALVDVVQIYETSIPVSIEKADNRALNVERNGILLVARAKTTNAAATFQLFFDSLNSTNAHVELKHGADTLEINPPPPTNVDPEFIASPTIAQSSFLLTHEADFVKIGIAPNNLVYATGTPIPIEFSTTGAGGFIFTFPEAAACAPKFWGVDCSPCVCLSDETCADTITGNGTCSGGTSTTDSTTNSSTTSSTTSTTATR
jgi:hypothetical protein